MHHALSRFAELLRREGVRVSPGELLDAAAATRALDLGDRDALHAVLAATLLKRRDDEDAFRRAFDRFFAPPAWGRGRKRRRRKKRKGGDGTGDGGAAGDVHTGQGSPRGPRSGGGVGSPPEDAPRRASSRPSRGTSPRPSSGASRTPSPPPSMSSSPPAETSADHPSPSARDAAGGILAARRERLDELRRGPGSRHARDRDTVLGRTRVLRAPHRVRLDRADDDARARGWHADADPVARRLGTVPFRDRWAPEEGDALADELAHLLARLRLRRTRRRRRARRGRLWIQRMVRANVGHDLVPFRLVHHRPRRREPRLVLLVDVSHSVARAASAFLTVVAGLTRSFRSVRVHVFVNGTVDVSRELPLLRTLGGRADALETLVATLPEVNPYALSDYGRVLHQLREAERGRIRRDTVLLILGDGRTNRADPAPWILEELGERAARVVWLVPEPMREWGRGDSAIPAYAPHVDVLAEVADLDGLRHALARVVRG